MTRRHLTPRERQVLAALCCGATNKQIAQSIGNSAETVKDQVASVLRKLGAENRAHAVAIALQTGVI